MSKYTALDERIMQTVSNGNVSFARIVSECSAAAWLAAGDDTNSERTIDRRMQALRKAGKIVYYGRAWQIVGGAK